jgi:hypothetical protein
VPEAEGHGIAKHQRAFIVASHSVELPLTHSLGSGRNTSSDCLSVELMSNARVFELADASTKLEDLEKENATVFHGSNPRR